MQYIYFYLEQNSDECQFSLDELMAEIEGDYRPHIKTVKAQLLKKYSDDISIAVTANKAPVVCFRHKGFKLLTEAWYNQKSDDKTEERRRIVKTAAAIVIEDIRSRIYEKKHYPPSDNVFQESESDIPETLRVFLDDVILRNKLTTLEPPAPETLLKLISCKCKKGCQKACGCRKAGLKCSVICTNCSGTCDNSQVPSHDSDEEEETEIVFEQTYDGIENEEDRDESDHPIADDAEEISVCDFSIDTEDDELATPGSSRTAKRRRLR
ncbi:hypothetical protein AVEN_141576-1 [Araneus ventricosus]|uniref:Tesmin/TSO1-like CXC domain-containing protein n=1 Tax=Araneus ventricosus TaxID=182803 RepID=A0A4Y1ZTM1_ARAVE|nr:hypothetical protein AVEN_8151-1 [Araneus ventricosus]GBL66172.1 hypothetical protein AVEN_230341-1 [Araneus ventricosus]GBL66282.1 hypothetical protein AVEN_116637-1 [Araneus ventricosus]GBL66295.1 hypothetical protein AVEN_141576-1 [Araneus ventricosus]